MRGRRDGQRRVIVIGGGPAGLMAAGAAAGAGAKVVLLERNADLGRKLLLTGNGRCNFTHDTDVAGLVAGMPGNGRFLHSAFSEMDSAGLRSFFRGLGVESRADSDGRVFPFSGVGRDVLAALTTHARRNGVEMRCGWKASRIHVRDGKVAGVIAASVPDRPGLASCDAAIMATGGITYPATGSTGDGYAMAAALGHTIVPPRAALVPIETEEPWVRSIAGLAIRNASASSIVSGRKAEEESGDVLFTHYGLSGPAILALSRGIAAALARGEGPVRIVIDLRPDLSPSGLDERIREAFDRHFRRRIQNALFDLVPVSLAPILIREAGIAQTKPVSHITREERLALGRVLKALVLTATRTRPDEEGIVTAGGVSVEEIDPRSMESRLVEGMYFAGEVMDVDGRTGGFNLQAAFSTGFVAGLAAGRGGCR